MTTEDTKELGAWREFRAALVITPLPKQEGPLPQLWPNMWPERVSVAGFIVHKLYERIYLLGGDLARHQQVIVHQKELLKRQQACIEDLRAKLLKAHLD